MSPSEGYTYLHGDNYISVAIGPTNWTTGHCFMIQYIVTSGIPCLKFTSLTDSVKQDWPCTPHVTASRGAFRNLFCMPTRGVLDLLHLLVTHDKGLVRDSGYANVFPRDGSTYDGCYYSVVVIGNTLDRMRIPARMNVPRSHREIPTRISGFWSIYKLPRGPVLITSDAWVDWEDDQLPIEPGISPLQIQNEDIDMDMVVQEYSQDSHDSGCEADLAVEQCDGDKDDSEDDEEDSSNNKDDSDDDEDDSDDEDEFVFPLCHIDQVFSLVKVLHQWLRDPEYTTRHLIVSCKVPERITLVPMPREEDGYRFTQGNLVAHWPKLTKEEVDVISMVTYGT